MDKDEVKHGWDEVLAKLRQERDELALKVHLGKKEAAAEWEKLEAKWHEIKTKKMPPMKEAAVHAPRDRPVRGAAGRPGSVKVA